MRSMSARLRGKSAALLPSLWIVDGDAVDKNGELVKGAAIDADVRLNAKRTALSDIDSSAEFQCVVDTRDTRRREFCTAEGSHLSCCLVGSEGSARSGGDHFAQTLTSSRVATCSWSLT